MNQIRVDKVTAVCEQSIIIEFREGDKIKTLITENGITYARLSKSFEVVQNGQEMVISNVNFLMDQIILKDEQSESESVLIYTEKRIDINFRTEIKSGANLDFFVINETKTTGGAKSIKDGSVWVKVNLL